MFWDRSKLRRRAHDAGGGIRGSLDYTPDSQAGRDLQFNILASQANWAWPAALREIFRPRGINLLVAEDTDQFVEIIRARRIHTAILDTDSDRLNALATIKIIRMDYPLVPCILLSSAAGESLLGAALQLDVFSVIEKPVNMGILREQLNRLFTKKYNSDIFA